LHTSSKQSQIYVVSLQVPFKILRETAGLEDSFLMWTRIVYLHLWILLSQVINKGGRDGEVASSLWYRYLKKLVLQSTLLRLIFAQNLRTIPVSAEERSPKFSI